MFYACIYLLRESRHFGISLLLDSLRYLSIHEDVRELVDYLFLKSQGISGLSDDLKFLYRFFSPGFVRSMNTWEFILVCREGGLGVGHFPDHEWHKREKENIIKAVGLQIEYGQVLELPKTKGDYETVGDSEHSQIITLYAGEGLSMNKIADQLGRSTRTPKQHIDKHNAAVQRSGFCAVCRRVGSPFQSELAERKKNEG